MGRLAGDSPTVTRRSGQDWRLFTIADRIRSRASALVAVTTVHSIDVPAVRGAVLAWVIVWFVLGYLQYATVYGALGSLGSRAEDAQSVAGPVMVMLAAGYFASFAMIAQPTSAAARVISFFPLTAPMAMPDRIAMGVTAWWEPVAIGVVIGVAAAVVTSDVIIGVIAGAGFIAVATQMVKLWTHHVGPPVAHR